MSDNEDNDDNDIVEGRDKESIEIAGGWGGEGRTVEGGVARVGGVIRDGEEFGSVLEGHRIEKTPEGKYFLELKNIADKNKKLEPLVNEIKARFSSIPHNVNKNPYALMSAFYVIYQLRKEGIDPKDLIIRENITKTQRDKLLVLLDSSIKDKKGTPISHFDTIRYMRLLLS